jgi:hypothetical protein
MMAFAHKTQISHGEITRSLSESHGKVVPFKRQEICSAVLRQKIGVFWERASAVLPTQAEAIAWAKEHNPKATPMIERVRNTKDGHPDKWRT